MPTTTYALSKVATETVAARIAQWSGMPFVALRFSNIMAPGDYEKFPSLWPDPYARRWNLWGYVDARLPAAAARPFGLDPGPWPSCSTTCSTAPCPAAACSPPYPSHRDGHRWTIDALGRAPGG